MHISSRTILFLALGVMVGLLAYHALFPTDGRTVSVSASGTAEWLYQANPNGHEMHTINFERHTLHSDSKELGGVPSFVTPIQAGGNRQTAPVEERNIIVERIPVEGEIHLEVTDVSPIDSPHSKDTAHMTATFLSPSGEHLKIVLKRLVPPEFPSQAFGGVAINHFINGDTNLGSDKLHTEFAYQILYGLVDLYKDDELLVTDVFTYIATSQRAEHALNTMKALPDYDPSEPMGKMIVHTVVFPYGYNEETGAFEFRPSGIIGPNGQPQEFLHVNFVENIRISGNRYFNSGGEFDGQHK